MNTFRENSEIHGSTSIKTAIFTESSHLFDEIACKTSFLWKSTLLTFLTSVFAQIPLHSRIGIGEFRNFQVFEMKVPLLVEEFLISWSCSVYDLYLSSTYYQSISWFPDSYCMLLMSTHDIRWVHRRCSWILMLTSLSNEIYWGIWGKVGWFQWIFSLYSFHTCCCCPSCSGWFDVSISIAFTLTSLCSHVSIVLHSMLQLILFMEKWSWADFF